MDDAEVVHLDGLLRQQLKEKNGVGITEAISKLKDEELNRLWNHAVIKGLNGFRYLNMSNCQHLTDASLFVLHNMQTIVDVSVKNCKMLSPNAITNWVSRKSEITAFPALQSLDLSGTGINDSVASYLVAAFPNLRRLTLGRTKITNHAISVLSQLKRLQNLNLSGCKSINSQASIDLLKFPKLVLLDISLTGFSESEKQTLIKNFHKLKYVDSVTPARATSITIKHKRQSDNATEIAEPPIFESRAISQDDLISGLLACESSARFYVKDGHRGAPLAAWLRDLSFQSYPPSTVPFHQSQPKNGTQRGNSRTETNGKGTQRMDFALDEFDAPRNPLYDLISAASLDTELKTSRTKPGSQYGGSAPTFKATTLNVPKPTSRSTRLQHSPQKGNDDSTEMSIGLEALLGAADFEENEDTVSVVAPSRDRAPRDSFIDSDSTKQIPSKDDQAPVLQPKKRDSKSQSSAVRPSSVKPRPSAVRAPVPTASPKKSAVPAPRGEKPKKSVAAPKPAPSARVPAPEIPNPPQNSEVRRVVAKKSAVKDHEEEWKRDKRRYVRKAPSDLAESEKGLAPALKKPALVRATKKMRKEKATPDVAETAPQNQSVGSELPIARKTRAAVALMNQEKQSVRDSGSQTSEVTEVRHERYGVKMPLPGQCVLGPPPAILRRFKNLQNQTPAGNFRLNLSYRAKTAYKVKKSMDDLNWHFPSSTGSHTPFSASLRSVDIGSFVVSSIQPENGNSTTRRTSSNGTVTASTQASSSMDIDIQLSEEDGMEDNGPRKSNKALKILSYVPPVFSHHSPSSSSSSSTINLETGEDEVEEANVERRIRKSASRRSNRLIKSPPPVYSDLSSMDLDSDSIDLNMPNSSLPDYPEEAPASWCTTFRVGGRT